MLLEKQVTLYSHQQSLVDKAPDRCLIAFGVGCGKTITALCLAVKKAEPLLIVCPKGLVTQWQRNCMEYLGPSGKRLQYTITSKETFRRDWQTLPGYQTVVIDEAQYFAGQKSQMSKNLGKYFKKHAVQNRYLLTGTPYTRDCWSVFVLANHLGHAWNYIIFKARFFNDVRMGMRFIPVQKKGIEAEISKLVQKIGVTAKIEDLIDLPPQTFEEEYFDITKEQKKAIEAIIDVEPIVKYGKEYQICGGFLKGDGYVADMEIESNKKARLIEVVENNDRLIIVCRHRGEIDMLARILAEKTNVAIINGDTQNRQDILDGLEKKERYCLIVSASISEGWQVRNCRVMVFYSFSFALKDYLQMQARINRIDNPQPNTYLTLIIKDSIDEAVFKRLKAKEDFHIHLYRK